MSLLAPLLELLSVLLLPLLLLPPLPVTVLLLLPLVPGFALRSRSSSRRPPRERSSLNGTVSGIHAQTRTYCRSWRCRSRLRLRLRCVRRLPLLPMRRGG